MATDVDERRFGDLTVRIDRLLCVGFGDCIDVAPDLFEFDDEGIAVFLAGAGDLGQAAIGVDRLREACESCPVDAITLLDADGTVLAP